MANQTANVALGPARTGVPVQSSTQSAIASALAPNGTVAWSQNQGAMANFNIWLQDGTQWIESTLKSTGYPVTWTEQDNQDGTKAVFEVKPSIDQTALDAAANGGSSGGAVGAAADGGSSSGGFDWNGSSYSVVGAVTGTFTYKGTPNWTMVCGIGVSGVASAMLLKTEMNALLLPLIRKAKVLIVRCFKRAMSAVGVQADEVAASAGAAEDMEGADVGVDEVAGTAIDIGASIGAGVGLVLVAAIPFIIRKLSHPSYHNLKLYNLTSYDLTWSLSQMSGALNTGPSAGDASNPNALSYVVPAMSNDSPDPDITPVVVAHEADFGFVSTTGDGGIGYVLNFELRDPENQNQVVQRGQALFSVPWKGENSLYVAFSTDDAQTFWQANNGKVALTTYSAQSGNVKASVTLDYLDGAHGTPVNGKAQYVYNSLLVLDDGSGA